MSKGGGVPVPEHLDFDGSHIAAIKPHHVNEADRGERGFDLLHIQRIVTSIMLHHITRMPVPAMTPEIQRIMVGGIIGFCPCHEIDQCLFVTEVSLAPIGNCIGSGSSHSFCDMK